MFCKVCGEVIPDDCIYCPKCGTAQRGEQTSDEKYIYKETAANTGKKILKATADLAMEMVVPVLESCITSATGTATKRLSEKADKTMKKYGLKEKTRSEKMRDGISGTIDKAKNIISRKKK